MLVAAAQVSPRGHPQAGADVPASNAQPSRLDADAAAVTTGRDLGEQCGSVVQVLQVAPPHGQPQAGAVVPASDARPWWLDADAAAVTTGQDLRSVLGPSGRLAGGALKRGAAEGASYDDDDADTSVEHDASFCSWHARLSCSCRLPVILLIIQSVSVFVCVTS